MRLRGRSRHRARRSTHDRVVITPTYTGCPATIAIERDIRAALDARGLRARRDRNDAVAALDDRLDQRRRPRKAARLRHRAAAERRRALQPQERRAAAMPALRFAAHRRDQPLRLDAVQGALALPACARAVRPLQVPLMSINVDFHKLQVAEVRRETPDAVSIRFEVPEELRKTLRLPGRPAPDAADRHRRRGRAPQLFGLRRAAAKDELQGSPSSRCRRRLLRLGRTTS